MSASREKKTRQDTKGQELTEKQLQAQKDAQRAKRNGILYTAIGIVAAVLVAALLLWNSGLFQSRAKALTIGDQSYSAADVQYYYNQVYSQYYMYAQYGLVSGFDVSVSPAEQMYDEEAGTTWHDQILDEAVDTMVMVKTLAAKADQEGTTLSDEGVQTVKDTVKDVETAAITSGYTTTNSYLKAIYGSTMTKGRYEKLLRESALADQVQTAYADSLTYTEEQLEEYYAENKDALEMIDYHIACVYPVESEEEDEDAAAAAMNTAHDTAHNMETALYTGVPFADLMDGYEEAEDVDVEYYTDQSSAALYLDSSISAWIAQESRTAGDVTAVESSDGSCYYVVQFLGRGRDEEIPGDVRHILVAAEQDEDADQPTDAQYDAAKAKAEELLAQWKAGAATEESFAELAKAESADPGSAEEGGLYEDVDSSTGFIADFTNWVIDPAREVGDTGLVKNTESSTKGWHILYYAAKGEPNWKTEARSALNSEDVSAWLDELVDAQEVTRLDGIANVG